MNKGSKSSGWQTDDMVGAGVRVERVFDLLTDKVFPPVDAVRVDMLQHAHAVARASGDLTGCSSGVQPQRQGGMPQVVMCSSRPLNAESEQFSDHE
jgi:hypothetical protein